MDAPLDTSSRWRCKGWRRPKPTWLMEVAAGHVPAVAAALREVPGPVSVDAVMGPYDIILVVQANGLAAAHDLVSEHVHSVSGVERTVTCLAIS